MRVLHGLLGEAGRRRVGAPGPGSRSGAACSSCMKSIAYCEVFVASFFSLIMLPAGYDAGSTKLASS